MNTLVPALVLCQALGAALGALSAVWGELAYVRSMRDGKIDSAERAHLHAIARGLRFGMSLLLLSSFGLVSIAYLQHTSEQSALSSSYWTLIALALFIITVTRALSRQRISFAFGSAIAVTGRCLLVFLTLGEIPPLSFGSAVAFFVVATAIFYALLQYMRFLLVPKRG